MDTSQLQVQSIRIPGADGTMFEVVICTGLSLGARLALEKHMYTEACEHYFGATAVERCRGLLDALPHELRLEAVRELVRQQSQRILDQAAYTRFQSTPAGLAVLLYHYGRTYTPGLSLEKLRAIINETNAHEVLAQLIDARISEQPVVPGERHATPNP